MKLISTDIKVIILIVKEKAVCANSYAMYCNNKVIAFIAV